MQVNYNRICPASQCNSRWKDATTDKCTWIDVKRCPQCAAKAVTLEDKYRSKMSGTENKRRRVR